MEAMGVTIEEQKIAQFGNDDAKYRTCQAMNATFRTDIARRLGEERRRLELSQDALASFGQISRRTQAAWEKGEQAPHADYLALVAAAGVDVSYVVTGARSLCKEHSAISDLTSATLPNEEVALIENYRSFSDAQRAALATITTAFLVANSGAS